MLPLIRRELLVTARAKRTYYQRLFVGSVVFLVAAGSFAFPASTTGGLFLFRVLSIVAFVLCLLEGLRTAAPSLAAERAEGTLGLLFLTDMRPWQVLASKLTAAATQSFTSVIAVSPAFMIPLLIGGVTGGESVRLMVTLALTLALALAVGAFASAITASSLGAYFVSLLLLLFLFAPPCLVSMFETGELVTSPWAGPLMLLLGSTDDAYKTTPGDFWWAAALTLLWSVLLIIAAGWLLTRNPPLETRTATSGWMRWVRAGPKNSVWSVAASRDEPALWLAEQTLPGRNVLWASVIIGAVFCFGAGLFGGKFAAVLIIACVVTLTILLNVWMAAIAPQSINASRRSGALELLLCTPLEVERLIKGQVEAMVNYFIAPGMVLSILLPGVGVLGAALSANESAAEASIITLMFGVFWLGFFVLVVHAFAYTGVWHGLINARPERAVGQTVFKVLILPLLTLLIPVCGFFGVVLWPMYWISYCARRLRLEFRQRAAEPLSS
jgi:hypothetical protein